jgi:hypothetical protein
MSVPSINDNRWLCIVVDDVSRLPFLFFMKNKDDAATYIKEYVDMVNTQQLGGVKVQQMGHGVWDCSKDLKQSVRKRMKKACWNRHIMDFRHCIFDIWK